MPRRSSSLKSAALVFGVAAILLLIFVVNFQTDENEELESPGSRKKEESEEDSQGGSRSSRSSSDLGGGIGGVSSSPNATKKIELSRAFSMALEEGGRNLSSHFGIWDDLSCDQCSEDCLTTATRGPPGIASSDGTLKDDSEFLAAAKEAFSLERKTPLTKADIEIRHKIIDRLAWTRHVSEWGPLALRNLADENLMMWEEKGGIKEPDHTSMMTCTFKTRMKYNPFGFWVHISGNNITILLRKDDAYHRSARFEALLKYVVKNGPPFKKPLVAFFSVMDTPCNPSLPFLSFFGKRGSQGILIPDDTFNPESGWEELSKSMIKEAKATPFKFRRHQMFFRGTPSHVTRSKVEEEGKSCCKKFTNITLTVVRELKRGKGDYRASVPLAKEPQIKYLLAIRGRTASNRDKYLNAKGGAILKVEAPEPWFSFYHVLWKPWLNYIPVNPERINCTVIPLADPDKIDQYDPIAEKIAARGVEVAEFLTNDAVFDYMRYVMNKYAELQRYPVSKDPIEFLNFMKRNSKKYHSAQLIPEYNQGVRAMWPTWLRRRIKQLVRCNIEEEHGIIGYDKTGNPRFKEGHPLDEKDWNSTNLRQPVMDHSCLYR